MRLGPDELAGVVDLFGALSREELESAVEELAFRQGEEFDGVGYRTAVEDAIADYHLVAVAVEVVDASEGLVVGPTAFPTLPEHGQDLPHIVDIPTRSVDRGVVGEQVEQRLRREAAQAVDAGDRDRIQTLLDVTYDLEAWGPVTVDDVRTRLSAALDGT